MARIELRETTIYLQDGTDNGTAVVSNSATPLAVGATTCPVTTVDIGDSAGTEIPRLSRVTFAGSTAIHWVTGTTGGATTTEFTFSPALTSEVADASSMTFYGQNSLEVKIGDGNLTWSVSKDYTYDLERGNLKGGTVRQGDQQALAISLDTVYEYVTTGSDNVVTPFDAFNNVGGASDWSSSASDDPCAPFALDIIIDRATAACNTSDDNELTILPDYRYESLEADIDAATISTSGSCFVELPVSGRTAQA